MSGRGKESKQVYLQDDMPDLLDWRNRSRQHVEQSAQYVVGPTLQERKAVLDKAAERIHVQDLLRFFR